MACWHVQCSKCAARPNGGETDQVPFDCTPIPPVLCRPTATAPFSMDEEALDAQSVELAVESTNMLNENEKASSFELEIGMAQRGVDRLTIQSGSDQGRAFHGSLRLFI